TSHPRCAARSRFPPRLAAEPVPEAARVEETFTQPLEEPVEFPHLPQARPPVEDIEVVGPERAVDRDLYPAAPHQPLVRGRDPRKPLVRQPHAPGPAIESVDLPPHQP